ncbi:diacylglycerol/lipid kinase family protein [Actinoplanes sp. NPDC049599]|uniref:diacylglycerol/lipid kinase family protein n=1 Tax=Actinoplanes sp. NPDC049599 TaxID=3363903 RepID=UPI0037AD058D
MIRDAFTAVVNPAAGSGTAAATMISLARALRESGARVRVTYSRSLPHATELAAAAAGRGDTVLAAGGDGLAGAVAAGLTGTTAELGLVPAGRGNDLARAVPLPRDDPATFAAALRERPSRPIDVAMAGDRVVLGSVCAGLDSVANDAANRWRLPRRPIAYQIAAVLVLARWHPVTYDLRVDGVPERVRGNTVVAANCAWYGGALKIAPAALLDDGLLELVTIGEMSRRRLVPVLTAMRRGAHVGMPGITSRPIREVTIATDRPIPFYADGEKLPAGPVTVRVRPAALHLIGA